MKTYASAHAEALHEQEKLAILIEMRPTIDGVRVVIRDWTHSGQSLGEFRAHGNGSNLPTPEQVVEVAKRKKVGHLITLEAAQECLQELAS